MATVEECEAAVRALGDRLASPDGSAVRGKTLDRSVSCAVPDLRVVFSGRLDNGHLVDVTREPRPRAQIRLTVASDDLVALTDGRLSVGGAWSSGRLKVEANVLDLLRLRSLM